MTGDRFTEGKRVSQAYAPGLKVTPRTRHRVRRWLPVSGEVLVTVGQQVSARDVVAHTFIPGDLLPVNLARILSIPPGDVPSCMLRKEGDKVQPGDLLARSKGIFGLFKQEYHARVAGTVETISPITGQVILRGDPQPLEVRAFLTGKVVEVMPQEGCVIEAEVAFVQGIFGIGGEAYGPLRCACTGPDEPLDEDRITPALRGAIVVGGARITAAAIRKAVEVGASAIVSGGIDDQDLRDFLGYDLGVAVTGGEDVGLVLVITEGFGDIAMAQRTFDLLRSHEGDDASISGATQIRAGVVRPEVVVPLKEPGMVPLPEERSGGGLRIGAAVRIIRDPYFGQLGVIQDLPTQPQELASGSKARVCAVRLNAGNRVVVPRANVELIEE